MVLFSLIAKGSVIYSFTLGNPFYTAISAGLGGFFTIPLVPICFELGVEITHPVDESFSAAFLMTSEQILSAIFNVSCSMLIQHFGKDGCLYS